MRSGSTNELPQRTNHTIRNHINLKRTTTCPPTLRSSASHFPATGQYIKAYRMTINPVTGMINDNYGCQGTVESLKGQRVLFTGKTFYRGEHRLRKQLEIDVRDKGGRPKRNRDRNSTLLVLGGLHPDVVIDRKNVRSQTLVLIDEQDSKGRHICIVDDTGYEALINDRPAPCIQFRRTQGHG